MTSPAHAIRTIWESPAAAERRFAAMMAEPLPPAARRYLRHALAPGVRLAGAVRLRMRGTIRLGGAWHPFRTEQASWWGRGFVWRARARIRGVPVSGHDLLLDGSGRMRWRALGVVPVAGGRGPDVSRSAAGRLNGELVWLPAGLLAPQVTLFSGTADRVEGVVRAHGDDTPFWMELAADGAVMAAGMQRWGNPDGQGYRRHPFGGIIEAEGTVDGVTIPTAVRMGWYFGSDRFEAEGEFFRATIDSAEFR